LFLILILQKYHLGFSLSHKESARVLSGVQGI